MNYILQKPAKIWTFGHSTRQINEFISILLSFEIELLADVRSYPGSKRYPQFNKNELMRSLNDNSIDYKHIALLGGRRNVKPGSENTEWRNKSFRAYADYMETEDFIEGINELLRYASAKRTVIMCAEALWWRCHRSMISDYLKSVGIEVIHIMGIGKFEPHEYTKPAKIVDGKLTYH